METDTPEAQKAKLRRENAQKARQAAELEFPDERFISDNAEFQAINRFSKGLVIPENVMVAESRAPINPRQREILRKELRQSEILSKLGNYVVLIPEKSGYKIRPKDALVNGKLFEFRTVEGNAETFQWEFRTAKRKGADTNVYINILSEIGREEAKRRVWLVLRRHPEYTGEIIMSFDDGKKTYFWDTDFLRRKKSLPTNGRARGGKAELNHNRSPY